MSDITKVCNLLSDLGIMYTTVNYKDGDESVVLTAGSDARILGYSDYFVRFDFDESGKFENITIGQ